MADADRRALDGGKTKIVGQALQVLHHAVLDLGQAQKVLGEIGLGRGCVQDATERQRRSNETPAQYDRIITPKDKRTNELC